MGKYRGSDFVYRRVKKKIDGRYIILAILILMMIVLGGTFLFLKENRKVSFVENKVNYPYIKYLRRQLKCKMKN